MHPTPKIDVPRECRFKAWSDEVGEEVEHTGYVVHITNLVWPGTANGDLIVICEDGHSGHWHNIPSSGIQWLEPTKPMVEQKIAQHQEMMRQAASNIAVPRPGPVPLIRPKGSG